MVVSLTSDKLGNVQSVVQSKSDKKRKVYIVVVSDIIPRERGKELVSSRAARQGREH